MAKELNTKIPDEHHLMRYVPYGLQDRDPDTDEFRSILPQAFSIRQSDEGGLSVTWVEFYGSYDMGSINKAAHAFSQSLNSKKLPRKAYFAIGKVEETKTACAGFGKRIRVVHVPDGENLGHVELHRFTDDDRALLDLLALDVFHIHIAVTDLN